VVSPRSSLPAAAAQTKPERHLGAGKTLPAGFLRATLISGADPALVAPSRSGEWRPPYRGRWRPSWSAPTRELAADANRAENQHVLGRRAIPSVNAAQEGRHDNNENNR
jgi:hypothetical protein